MSDNLRPDDRKQTMQAVKSKGTKLEKRLFALLARMGFRGWTKNEKNVIGKPDVAFSKEKIAIFVDGCFWHGCSHCNRKLPQTNRAYWERKIKRNVSLAKSYNRKLKRAGWTVIRIWEHELLDTTYVKNRLKELSHERPEKRKQTNSYQVAGILHSK